MLTGLLFLLSSFLFGIACSNFLHFLDDWWKKSAFAIGFGILISSWLVFLLSWATGMLGDIPIFLSCALMLGFFFRFYKHRQLKITHDKTGLLFVLAIFALLAYLNFRLLPHIENGQMIAGSNIWGDYPFHLGVIYSFAERPNYPPVYPILATAPLAYPFMVNFLSAILLRGGFDLSYSLILPHLLSYFVMLSFLYFIGALLLKRKLIGMLFILLFLFNGNWGIASAFKDAMVPYTNPIDFLSHSPDPLKSLSNTFLHPSKAYSHIDIKPQPFGEDPHFGPDGIEFMNQLFSTFLPQRAAIMGIALSILFYYLIFISMRKPEKHNLLFAGVILGLLPLVHGHTFLIAAFFSPFAFAYSLYKSGNRKETLKLWLYLIFPSLLLSIPQLLFMRSQLASTEFLHYRFGWMQGGPISAFDFILYWLRNFGIILPLAIAGLKFAPNYLRFSLIPVFIVFMVGNLYQLAPWDWDTIKVFGPFFMFLCLFAAIALEKLVDSKKRIFRRFGGIILLILLIFAIFSGILTLFWWHEDRPVLYSGRDFIIADYVKNNTPANAIWITSDAHTHVIPSLTGRQTVLGLKWYLYSHGLEKMKIPVERDINYFFQTADCSVPLKYGATYLFIGVQEDNIEHANRQAFENNPNFEPFFDKVVEGFRTTMYKIKCKK